MATKSINGVIIPRHDIEANWKNATDFVPRLGELIVYEADTTNPKVRFKFGDGRSNVNSLPFASSDIKAEDLSKLGYVTRGQVESIVGEYILNNPGDGEGASEAWVKEYVTNNVGSIVYLSTRESTGENIELQDVYPIQSSDSTLKVVSKNKLIYTLRDSLEGSYMANYNGVYIKISNDINVGGVYDDSKPYFSVYGKSSGVMETELEVGYTTFDSPGKYTISLHDYAGIVAHSNCSCYLKYMLKDAFGNTVQDYMTLDKDPIVINTRELNAYKAVFKLYFKVYSGITLSQQDFKLQVEFGDTPTKYTHPRTLADCSGKLIDIYGRNLVNPNEVYTNGTNTPLYDSKGNRTSALNSLSARLVLCGVVQPQQAGLGVHYLKGTVVDDNVITLSDADGILSENYTIKTPLLKGDDFTLIFNSVQIIDGVASVSDLQVVYGHTDYEEYLPYELDTVESDAYGVCDISHLKYPYSLLSIHNFDSANDGLAVAIKYDPALSRDWTERQLEKIENEIAQLIENGVGTEVNVDLSNYYTKEQTDELINSLDIPNIEDVNLSNYYTKAEVDSFAEQIESSIADINNDIVVSETEPVVSQETIWIQPILTDTGAIDYIVEQSITSDGYYEKWNSGIVKYYGSTNYTGITSTELSGDRFPCVLTISGDICKEVISRQHSIHNYAGTYLGASIVGNTVGFSNNKLVCSYSVEFNKAFPSDANISFSVHHQIIGFWK